MLFRECFGFNHSKSTTYLTVTKSALIAFLIFCTTDGRGAIVEPSFITNRSFPSGSNNRGAAVADFNNDGKLDIVTINATSPTNQAGVMLGNGDGTFANPIMTNVEQGAFHVVVGDFNSDNRQDLAYTVSGARSVAVQLGNGNGTFALPDIFFVALINPRDLIAKDFNNDGKLDIACINDDIPAPNYQQRLSILFGDGLGGLGSSTNYPVDPANFGSANTVASADTDGDGDFDIIVATEGGQVYRYLNNGNGSFTVPVIIGQPNTSNQARAIFGNFNQDNTPDMAISYFGYPGQNLPRITFSLSGSPGFTTRQVARESGERAEVDVMVAADLDGDGRNDDIAFSRGVSRSVIVMINAGEANGEITSYFGGSAPRPVLTGDFNNDNRIDIAVAQENGDQVWILLNAGNGRFNAPLRPTTRGFANREIKSGDFNGDVFPDIAIATADGEAGGLQIFSGISGGLANMSYLPEASHPGASGLGIGDINNDNKQDIVIARGGSGGIAPFLGNGNGTFNYVNANFGATGYSDIELGEYNADNRIDAVVTDFDNDRIGYFRGNGQGAFNSAVFFNTGDGPYGLVTHDFNSDGKQDVAIANFNGNNVSVLIGNGDGTFPPPTNFGVGTSPGYLVVGDFNGDSKADLAVQNTNSNDVSILLGNGLGSFSGATNFPANNRPFNITSGDLNGDGILDIAVISFENSTLSILTGNGNGSFNAPITITGFFNQPRAVKAMDVNADGKLDLVVTNLGAASLTVLINNTPAAGFEGDVAPRPDGDGQLASADVVQIRRFVAGLDTANAATNEFQRADSAPRATFGDGALNSTDVVQARRYVVSLDPPTNAGGPTVAVDPPLRAVIGGSLFGAKVAKGDVDGSLRLVNGKGSAVVVELESGREVAAVSFRVRYGAALGKPFVSLGELPDGAVLTVNDSVDGELTILIDSAGPLGDVWKVLRLVEISFGGRTVDAQITLDGTANAADVLGNDVRVH